MATLIQGLKWNHAAAPQPFRRGRKADSHDTFFRLGKKKYGRTKADSLTEEILLEDYGSYKAIWNAYENNQILLSPELAAGIKAKIEFFNK